MSSSADINSSDALKQRARELGFSLVGITPAARPDSLGHFQDWLQQGLHGTMEYLPRRAKAYEHPEGVQVGVRSIIVAAMNYGPGAVSGPSAPSGEQARGTKGGDHISGEKEFDKSAPSPRPSPARGDGEFSDAFSNEGTTTRPSGRVAAYAQGTSDYHDILRKKLQLLADELHRLHPQARTRIAIDTAPLLERDVARRAGLGWFGKNTMLINKWSGSYFFLGAILTDWQLPPDEPHQTDHCGTCTRCLEACPTDAFREPYVLDAGRCISYLTIELRNRPIPRDLRQGVGDWLFGCDVCQQVCPWNRHATPPDEPGFRPQQLPTPVELLNLSEEEFQARYSKTPFARPGRIGMARNAAIVLGNSRDQSSIPALSKAISTDAPLIRGAAAWALGEISSDAAHEILNRQLNEETDHEVRDEIQSALGRHCIGEKPHSLP